MPSINWTTPPDTCVTRGYGGYPSAMNKIEPQTRRNILVAVAIAFAALLLIVAGVYAVVFIILGPMMA